MSARPPCPNSRAADCPNRDGSETELYLGDGGKWACGACEAVFDATPVAVVVSGPRPGILGADPRGNADMSGSTTGPTTTDGGTDEAEDEGENEGAFLSVSYETLAQFAAATVGVLTYAALGPLGVTAVARTLATAGLTVLAFALLVHEAVRERVRGGRHG